MWYSHAAKMKVKGKLSTEAIGLTKVIRSFVTNKCNTKKNWFSQVEDKIINWSLKQWYKVDSSQLLFGCIGEYVPVHSQHSLAGLQWRNFAILSERDRVVYVRSVKLQVLPLISLQTGPHVPKSTFILERHIGSQSRRKKHVVFQFSPWKMFSNKMLKSPTRSNKNQKGNWAHPPFFVKIPSAAGTSDLVSWEKPNETCQSKLRCWILSRCPLEYPAARCWHPPHVQHLFRSSSSIIRINGIWISSWWFQPIWKILVKLDHFPR